VVLFAILALRLCLRLVFLSVLSVLEVFVNVNTLLSQLLERPVLTKRFPPFVPLFLNR
jgi:hypothetical protein